MEKNLIYLFLIPLIFIPLFSFAQVKLQKESEFAIESLYPVEIVDYFSSKKIYLGYILSAEGKRIVVINERGHLISDKVLEGDGPNKSAVPFNSMSFSEDGNIYLQTFSYIFRYDQNLNLIDRFSYPSSTSIRIYGRMEFFPYFNLTDSKSNFSFITNPSDTNSFRPGTETTKELIEIFQKGTEKPFKIAPITDRTMYSKFDKALLADLYFIIYRLDRKSHKLYLTTKTDSEIIVYDLVTKKLESRINIYHEDFKMLRKSIITRSDFPGNGRISLGPKNHKLFLLDGGKIVLDYIREIPYGTYEKKIADDPTYHHFQDPNYHRLILFDNTKQVSGDIALPANGKLMTSLPGNRLLFQLIDPNLEEDFVRYGIYKVVGISK